MPANDHTTSNDNLHREKEQARKRAYYEANKEACSARARARYHADKKKRSEYAKRYYAANKEKVRHYQAVNSDKIRARKKAYCEANQERIKAYRDENREKHNAEERMRDKRRYGLTDKEYFALLDSCKGRCPCCKSPFTKMFGTCATPCIDHCHESGKTKEGIRGIICNRCNLLLGYAHDSVKILRACADYLEQKKARTS